MICLNIHKPMPTPKRLAASPQGIAGLRANTCLLLLAVAPSFSVSAGEDAALIAQPIIASDTQGAAAPKSGSRQPAGSAFVANPANNPLGVAPKLFEEAQGFNTVCLDAEGRASGTPTAIWRRRIRSGEAAWPIAWTSPIARRGDGVRSGITREM